MKNTLDHQLKYATHVVILKQSPDGQPFWPIPDPLPPAIDARFDRSNSVFCLQGQHDIACGDLLVSNLSLISYSCDEICYAGLYCHLVEYVSIENDSSFVIAKQLYDAIKLPHCIFWGDELDRFCANLTKTSHSSRFEFAIFKRKGLSFWAILDSLPFKSDAYLMWESKPYYLFVFPGQHDIVRGNLLTDWSRYYLVRDVSYDCFVLAELIDVVKLSDRVYFNDFIKPHKPEPINDLVEFVASLTIGDVFADRWPPEHERANIYIFRDAHFIFYVGSSPRGKVYNRIRAHIKTKNNGHPDLHDLVKNNLPDSLNWNIDLYRVNKTGVSSLRSLIGESAFIVSIESNIIRRLCPFINQQFNPCPMPLPIRYKWHRR